MSEPFLSEIKVVSFNFPPKGWALCNGQLLPINQNAALFALLGVTYGGNGQTNFALPNLRGCVPVGFGRTYSLGERGGQTAHTIISQEMPQHNHFVNANSTAGNTVIPAGQILGSPLNASYTAVGGLVAMDPSSISNTGGSQPHTNMMPYLTLNFIIALQGIFPSHN